MMAAEAQEEGWMSDASGRRVISGSLRRVWLLLLIVCMSWGATALSQNPAVLSVAPSDSLLCDADVGAGKFSVVVVYSETMNAVTRPTLGFSPDVGGILSIASWTWSMTNVTDDTYAVAYDVADADVTAAGVDIAVDGARDTDGNPQTPHTQPDALDVDTQNPPAPSVPDLDPGSDHGLSEVDDVTNDSAPTFSGTAEAGSTIELRSSVSGSLGTTTASSSGAWTFTVAGGSPLIDGAHAISARATDPAGNFGPWSAGLALLIDTQAPPAPGERTPPDGARTNDNTPTFSWTIPSDPGESGVRGYRIQLSGPSPKDSYIVNTTYTPKALGDGDYTWRLYARDVAGNTGTWSGYFNLDVDTIPPAVIGVSTSDPLLTDADAGSRLTVTVDWSEAMNTGMEPTLTFNPAVATTLFLTRDTWLDGDTYQATYGVSDANVDHDGVTIDVTGAGDAAGNAQQDYSPQQQFGIDTLNPGVTGVLTNDPLVTDADVGGALIVTVDWSEPMDTGTEPALTLSPAAATTLSLASPTWPDSKTYQATYAISDANVDHGNVTIDVAGARDAAGNAQEDYAPESEFGIDTLNTTCTIGVGTAMVYDGDRVQEVTVNYDEAMSESPAPTIQFQTTTGFWTPGTGQWDGTRRIWTQSFTISDANEETRSVDVTVSGARDDAGNAQVANTLADAFDVDTRNPVVVSAVPSLTLIADANAGPGRFTVTVTYDEAMGAMPAPTIAFQDPAAGATLAPAGGPWTDARTYVATYNVTDQGAMIYDVDIRVTNARDVAGNVQVTSTTANAFDIDTQNPVISGLTVTGGVVDASCLRTVTLSATVTDANGCQNATAIILTSVELPTANARLGVPYDVVRTPVSSTTATITGKVDVQNLTSCPATVHVTLDAQDCAGNAAAQSQASGNVVDATSPAIANLVVTPQDGLVDGACEEPVTFSATVTDDCCIDPGSVIVTPSVANATMSAVVIDKVAFGAKEVRITGSLLVSDLTGCPAIVRVDVSATDSRANRSETDATANVYDAIIPVINDLWVTPVVEVSAACCFATIGFSANVTDNCCIHPENVRVTVTLPTTNAIPENTVVHRVQNGPGRVDVTGSVDVRCLSSCPARVSVRVDAYDCCGNDAVPVSSQSLEGLVIDVTPPEVQDDADRIREDTPTRIYVLENDDDNCTRKWQGEPCRCDGVLRIYDISAPPTYGTAAIEGELSHVRYAPFQDYRGPDEFTYRVIDACGNVSTEATVRLEVVPKLAMADGTYATCRDEPVAFTLQATEPLVTEESVGKFQFTILDGPAHGVLTGDLGDLRYEEPETALATLTYAPAAGFVGRDRIDVKFEDPYGESSTAVVDIDVTDCEGATPSLAVARGTVLPILLPASFAAAQQAGSDGITLTAGDGAPLEPGVLEQALSVRWDPTLGRYLLLLDTGPLSVATCWLTVPLGNGETVILELALGEGK